MDELMSLVTPCASHVTQRMPREKVSRDLDHHKEKSSFSHAEWTVRTNNIENNKSVSKYQVVKGLIFIEGFHKSRSTKWDCVFFSF